MLVERYVRAVCERGIDVESILVITYTRKAAGELRSAHPRRAARARATRSRARARRRLDLDDPRLLQPAAARASVRGRPRSALPRARGRGRGRAPRRGVRARARRSSAPTGDPERLRLLATYRADGLRRMLTGVYETLRSAGRELVLELGERPSIDERGRRRSARGRGARRRRVGDPTQRRNASEVLRVATDGSPPERLVDLSAFACKGARAASFEQARKAAERAALEELAAHDRDLLQELLERFGVEYAAAKRRESVVDFEDLQLAARDLLRDDEAVREATQLRFRHGHGRRVPGHEPAPVRAHRPRRASRAHRGLHGRRRVPVDLRVPARRSRGLPRAPCAGAEPARADAATIARARRCSRR